MFGSAGPYSPSHANQRCPVPRLLVAITSFLLASPAAFAGIQAPVTPVPEPITLSLLAAGVGGTLIYRRFRK